MFSHNKVKGSVFKKEHCLRLYASISVVFCHSIVGCKNYDRHVSASLDSSTIMTRPTDATGDSNKTKIDHLGYDLNIQDKNQLDSLKVIGKISGESNIVVAAFVDSAGSTTPRGVYIPQLHRILRLSELLSLTDSLEGRDLYIMALDRVAKVRFKPNGEIPISPGKNYNAFVRVRVVSE